MPQTTTFNIPTTEDLLFTPPYPEPPTVQTLADARRSLDSIHGSMSDLSAKIDAAETALAQIIQDSRCAINELQNQRVMLENKAYHTRAYLSPIRRLPTELLREIFMWNFDQYPCSAWVLAAVCSSWRRLALGMPRIWSKVSWLVLLRMYRLFW